ncbi:MAG: hypothetical protein ACHQ03_09340 [Candidatus Bathyarchaeia archaeon]
MFKKLLDEDQVLFNSWETPSAPSDQASHCIGPLSVCFEENWIRRRSSSDKRLVCGMKNRSNCEAVYGLFLITILRQPKQLLLLRGLGVLLGFGGDVRRWEYGVR